MGKDFYMAILDDLQALYDNGWDASFDYNGQSCGIFINSIHDIVVAVSYTHLTLPTTSRV